MSKKKLSSEKWDFKLPCSDNQWKRFCEFKYYIKKSRSNSPSVYWKKRHASFNIKRDKKFVFIKGLYNRQTDKEALTPVSFYDQVFEWFEKKKNSISRRLVGKKAIPPARLFDKRSGYVDRLNKRYNQKFKKESKLLLGQYFNSEYADVYAKLLDCIECLKNNVDLKSRNSFLEIGPGNGVFAYFLVKKMKFKKAYLIDLPVMIPTCFFWLSALAGEKAVILPGEKITPKTIFSLYLPGKIDLPYDSIDFSANITSFQEMNHSIVKDYFELIQKLTKPKGYFLCVNRFEKTTSWWRYPWPKKAKTIIEEEDLSSRTSSKMNKIIMRKLIKLTSAKF
jgi:putative sugar O-methyltransferase